MNILLADDRIRVRRALRILLEQQHEWKVIGEASDASELINQAENRRPDLVLLDSNLPGIHNDNTLLIIRQACPEVCIVALIDPQSSELRKASIQADAFATKVNPPASLLAVIRSCLERKACNE